MAVVVDRIAGGGGVSIPVSLTTSMGATTTDGILLGATNSATAGAQVFSPALHFQGSGWKTDPTAGAQSCDWKIEAQPNQSSAAPLDYLAFSNSINGAAYTANFYMGESAFYGVGATGTFRNASSLANANVGNYLWSLNPAQFYLTSGFVVTWASSATSAVTGVDTGLSRISAGVVGVGTGAAGSFAGTAKATTLLTESANGAQWIQGQASELLTISTVGLTTDTTANLLPADSIIEAVLVRITTTISGGGVATYSVGDPTTSTRFRGASANLAAGAALVDIDHWSGAVASLAAGPSQASAAKVRITCAGGTPTAGVIRITVFYRQFVAPTS